jgi:hypothetical protein
VGEHQPPRLVHVNHNSYADAGTIPGYLVEWTIALHGMYEFQLSVIFLFFLSP